MKVTIIKATVRYSRPLADGSYKTVELGCEGTLTASEEDWQTAQQELYNQLGQQMRYVFNGTTNSKAGAQEPQSQVSKPDHYCEDHQTEYQRFSKDGKVWYSHKAPDGKWCREK